MQKELFIYDIEVYRNYFLAVFVDKDGQNKHQFQIFQDKNEAKELVNFLHTRVNYLVGYNSSRYDDVILNLIRSGVSDTASIHNLSNQIILDNYDAIKQYRWMDKPWTTIDLMAIIENNMNRTSLKAAAIHLKWHKIQDLPIEPTSLIEPSQTKLLEEYCLNDVEITRRLFEELKPALTLRKNLSNEYSVDLLSASDSKIGKTVLEKMYGKPSVQETQRPVIRGKDLIPTTLQFQTKEFQQVQSAVENLTLQGKHQFSAKLTYNGITFSLGLGGLHTEDEPGLFKTDENNVLMDADVSSYYPSMILQYGIAPAHLDKEKFLKIYRGLVEERLEAKRKGDTTKADGVKITINAVFGMLRSKYFWLYDPLAFYKITIGGQLLLLQLCEAFFLAGIPVISANTDGVICQVPVGLMDKYQAVCQEWEKQTGLSLDYSEYKLYARAHVNGYVAVKKTGKVKTKGLFDPKLSINKFTLNKGYNSPVIALALQAYFIDGVSPEEFIPNHPDIHDFFKTQKSGTGFKLYARTIDGDTRLQKTNRYLVAHTNTALVKKHEDGRELSLLKKQTVWVGNNVGPDDNPPINYQYYINEVQKVIDSIEGTGRQLGLFDLPMENKLEVVGSVEEETAVSVEPDIHLSVSSIRVGLGKIDKVSPTLKKEYWELSHSFKNSIAKPNHILNRIMEGWCIGPLLTTPHLKRDNFAGLQYIAIDFDTEDEQSSIEVLSQHPIIKTYAYAIHSTISHTKSAPRSRVIFFLDKIVENPNKAALMLNGAYWRFGLTADQGVKNISRFWYGGKADTQPLILGNIMSLEDVRDKFVIPYQQWEKENKSVMPTSIIHPDDVSLWRKEHHLGSMYMRVATAPDKEKHFILYNTAYTLAGYVGGGYYLEDEIKEGLRNAIKNNPNNVRSLEVAFTTINDALEKGKLRPLYYEKVIKETPEEIKAAYVDGYSDSAVGLPPKFPVKVAVENKLLEYFDCKWEERVVDEETGEILSPGRLIVPFKNLNGDVTNEAHVVDGAVSYAEAVAAVFHTDTDNFGKPALVLSDPVEAMALYASAEVSQFNILAATAGLYNYDGLHDDVGTSQVKLLTWPGCQPVCQNCPVITLPVKPSSLSKGVMAELVRQSI